MPLYMIRRDLGQVSKDTIDAASIRALSCAYNYDHLQWLTSYWNEATGQIFCIYEALNEQQLIEHAAQSRIPCDEITLVHQVDPNEYLVKLPAQAKPSLSSTA